MPWATRSAGDCRPGHALLVGLISPRVGLPIRLTEDGKTIVRASYGRFHQGILTGELNPVHPGMTPTTTAAFDPTTGRYSRIISVVDPTINVRLDPEHGIAAERIRSGSVLTGSSRGIRPSRFPTCEKTGATSLVGPTRAESTALTHERWRTGGRCRSSCSPMGRPRVAFCSRTRRLLHSLQRGDDRV